MSNIALDIVRGIKNNDYEFIRVKLDLLDNYCHRGIKKKDSIELNKLIEDLTLIIEDTVEVNIKDLDWRIVHSLGRMKSMIDILSILLKEWNYTKDRDVNYEEYYDRVKEYLINEVIVHEDELEQKIGINRTDIFIAVSRAFRAENREVLASREEDGIYYKYISNSEDKVTHLKNIRSTKVGSEFNISVD